jgi:hypothetical protein
VNEQDCSGPIEDLNRAVEPEQMIWQKVGNKPSSVACVLQGSKVLGGDERKSPAYSSKSW